MARCEHYEVCGRDALDGHDGKCILHSEEPDKDEEAFEKALEEQREEHGADFRRMVFSNIALPEETFEEEANFSGARFKDVDFSDAIFKAANFSNAIFDEAEFRDATFEVANFSEATFEEVDFYRATFENVSFHKATIEWANFQRATFAEAYFRQATLKEAHFDHRTRFTEADFGGATFDWALFSGAIFEEGNFRDATFERAVFNGAIFEKGKFPNATFQKADFRAANFEVAEFRGSTFHGIASFRQAFVWSEKIKFEKANFSGCIFESKVLFAGKNESYRTFAGGEVSFVEVTIAESGSVEFRHADLSRCRFLRTALREVKFTGIKWCEDFSVKEWGSLDWFRGKEWFARVGLYDEILESEKYRTFVDILYTTIERMGSADGRHWSLFELGEVPRNDDRDVQTAWIDEREVLLHWTPLSNMVEVVPENKELQVERWSEIERLYRQLKRNHEERGDFPRGGDFHIGEKEARRKNPRTSIPLKLLLYTYRTVSKYGERAVPAALCLLAFLLGCAGIYDYLGAVLADPKAAQSLGLDSGDPLSYGGALRVSLEATFYPVRSVGFKDLGPYILNIVQRVVSPVLFALLALALRQRVKR